MEIIEPREVRYAGFWLRLAAYIIDYIVLQLVVGVMSLPFMVGMITGIIAASKEASEGPEVIAIVGVIMSFVFVIVIISLIVGWLYYALLESSKYQGTLGKVAVGIKVTDTVGNKITFARATGRYFGKIISSMTIYIGFIMAGFTVKKQALHDIMSDCLVIKK